MAYIVMAYIVKATWTPPPLCASRPSHCRVGEAEPSPTYIVIAYSGGLYSYGHCRVGEAEPDRIFIVMT